VLVPRPAGAAPKDICAHAREPKEEAPEGSQKAQKRRWTSKESRKLTRRQAEDWKTKTAAVMKRSWLEEGKKEEGGKWEIYITTGPRPEQ
jgi:hypothetical protein